MRLFFISYLSGMFIFGCSNSSSTSKDQSVSSGSTAGVSADDDSSGNGAERSKVVSTPGAESAASGEEISSSREPSGVSNIPIDPMDPVETTPAAAGVLTAGRFDDSLNPEAFKKYWNQKKAGDSYQWPPVEEIEVGLRFQGVKNHLDVLFIIDATGSMSDELSYLKKEVELIYSSIASGNPGIVQRYGAIVYRDTTDSYITKEYQLTSEIEQLSQFLKDQTAGGGGDYPEAMHTALAEANTNVNWADGDGAKIIFLIADAPPHDAQITETLESVRALAVKKVKIYPIAASGVGDIAEKVMRFAALVSGGEHLFLTDDSGVGNSHAEPKIPCYNVAKLATLMRLSLEGELKGERQSLPESEVIRTVGRPIDGICQQQ